MTGVCNHMHPYLSHNYDLNWSQVVIEPVNPPTSTYNLVHTPPTLLHSHYHWNNGKILRLHWNRALVDLVRHLGPQNVFVAVLESGSWDDSKEALRELDHNLAQYGVERWIELQEITHKNETERIEASDETGWVQTSRDRKERRRIPYLANLRNKVMLQMLKENDLDGKRFKKVLWLNDVIFTVCDYAAACSMDFSNPPYYYDTFALRDAAGRKTASQTWPYFTTSISRDAMISNSPVPMLSGWNGVVAMDAQAFYGHNALEFRGVHDDVASLHLEASECCPIHADNPVTQKTSVWLNPNVRVGYNAHAYETVNRDRAWSPLYRRIQGRWKLRLMSLTTFLRHSVEEWRLNSKLRRWRKASFASRLQG
ncbi:glycosyltransferase family 69 protein [Plenodomus tracheiphilus IPT5]|uniref:Glycosyltransferase family 69 protein n=1 Tax=Plenodomus tracheiphilus IPT5 TaxID=1408161 RepID=A0A6A7AX24_9PLEO|nr:glycosyltransferase family 69 protein [Plenodomus tracheiphilus IPT5]